MNYKLYKLFKTILLVIFFLFTVILLVNIFFPQEVFAMEPPKDFCRTDYYGQREYVGPDPYGYFHNPANIPTILNNSDNIQPIQTSHQDSYGTTTNIEKDWYATHDPHIIEPVATSHKPLYTLFISIKRRTYWYVWKIHSDDYSNYKDFKKSWNPSNSIRKEILADIKSFTKGK